MTKSLAAHSKVEPRRTAAAIQQYVRDLAKHGEIIRLRPALAQLTRFGAPRRRKYNRLVYSLYSLVLFVAIIVTSPWWLLEMLRHGKYRAGWKERWGTVPDRLFQQVSPDTIWIHAVSVGEVLAMSRVIEELKARLPGWRIVVSTTTDTGQKLARERFGADRCLLSSA